MTGGPTDPTAESAAVVVPDRRYHVSEYFRMERWETVPESDPESPSRFGGRVPIDGHQRGAGGGLRTGGLITSLDSLGGMVAGLSVLPKWIVTTSLMVTVSDLVHAGPLRLDSRIVRQGRNAVIVGLDVSDEGAGDGSVATALMTCAVLDPGDMVLEFTRPVRSTMPSIPPEPLPPEEFFRIEPGTGPVTRLELADHLRNPWGILHGGAVAVLADEAACRAAAAVAHGPVAAADTVLHYLRPVKVGPVEARCQVLGSRAGRTRVRVEVHDVGADDRLVTLASVAVVEV
jgi:uncharacterized protein (TIGR00369 family)